MKCPVCVDTDLSISSREGVEIDFCPQCRGVWLDRGELDKILDRAGAGQAAQPAPSYDRGAADRRPDDRSATRRKRRSFLDDLFDFD